MRRTLLAATCAAALSASTAHAQSCDPDYSVVTLTVGTQTGPYIASALTAAEWKERTCGTVNVVEFPWSELYPKIATALAGGEATFAPAWTPDFTPFLTEMPEAMRQGPAWEDIHPVYRERLMVWDGKVLSPAGATRA